MKNYSDRGGGRNWDTWKNLTAPSIYVITFCFSLKALNINNGSSNKFQFKEKLNETPPVLFYSTCMIQSIYLNDLIDEPGYGL